MSRESLNRESSNKKARKNTANRSKEPSLNLEEIKEIARLVERYGFTEFEFENEKIRIKLGKSPAPQIIQAVSPVSSVAPPIAGQPTATLETTQEKQAESSRAESKEAEADADEKLHKITSPIVGTFYRAPAPDKPPYVKIGDRVEPDTVVCIVEAMKLMNEIQAGVSGEVVKIYVENGQPVEYGQPLFGIKV